MITTSKSLPNKNIEPLDAGLLNAWDPISAYTREWHKRNKIKNRHGLAKFNIRSMTYRKVKLEEYVLYRYDRSIVGMCLKLKNGMPKNGGTTLRWKRYEAREAEAGV